MKKVLLLLLAVVGLMACSKKENKIVSPDGETVVQFVLADQGVPTYSVSKHGNVVVEPSPLGVVLSEGELKDHFEVLCVTTSHSDETWETVWGEEQYIRDEHAEMQVELRHASGRLLTIVFHVANDGFAFRYVFPHADGMTDELTVLDEIHEYRFVEDAQAWSIPWRTEYYEALWDRARLSEKKDTLCSPVTLEFANGAYGFLHEAAITNYPAQNLFCEGKTVKSYLTPWRKDGVEIRDKAYVTAPFSTPWRMLVLADNLPDMVASRLMLNLNEPCAIADAREWIKPMKFIGIWWGMHLRMWTWRMSSDCHGATTENMLRYLDFAADHHIGGVLAEGWNTGWEGYEGVNNDRFSFVTPYVDYDIDSLARHAHRRGVEIVFHHETSGRADEYEADLDTAYQYMQHYGMHAVKTGYVSPIVRTIDGPQWNKGQSGVRHYRKVLETSARYHVAIDNHEPVMPNGLQRTYPNLMTQEGIRGQEWNAWSADGGSPCEHVTVLPFTRFMAGPADYTPGVFHFENPIIPGTRVHSTLMNQLGLFVCFYSPLQMACDLPEHYMEHADAFQFIEDVPCDWQQSRLLAGTIGDYCVFARQDRHSDDWYVGGITDEQARTVTLTFDFLEEGRTYEAKLYKDGPDAQWEHAPYDYTIETLTLRKGDKLPIWMAEGGGFAISIKSK